jgi:ABC-2 type transport system permease protein
MTAYARTLPLPSERQVFWRGLLATLDSELKSLYREPAALSFTLVQPLVLLLILSAFNFHVRDAAGHMRPYIDVLLPGLIALNGLTVGFNGVTFPLARYKQRGILRRVRATPIPTGSFILGVIVSRLVSVTVVTLITYASCVWLFGANVSGNAGILLLLAVLGAAVFIALGILVVAFARSEDDIPPLFTLVLFPSLLFSGALLDRSGLPGWLHWLTGGLPLTFLTHAEQTVSNLGTGLGAVKGDLLGLLVWGILGTVLCAWRFRMA